MDSIKELRLTSDQLEEMRLYVHQRLPEEACGLVAGIIEQGVYIAQIIMPVTNSLHSRVRYRMDPKEQLEAFLAMEERGLDLLAIYHSHPLGPPDPSPVDIAEAYYPDALQLIWRLQPGSWDCQAYLIQNSLVREIPLLIDAK